MPKLPQPTLLFQHQGIITYIRASLFLYPFESLLDFPRLPQVSIATDAGIRVTSILLCPVRVKPDMELSSLSGAPYWSLRFTPLTGRSCMSHYTEPFFNSIGTLIGKRRPYIDIEPLQQAPLRPLHHCSKLHVLVHEFYVRV